MKTLEELQRAAHLAILGRAIGIQEEYEVYRGIVSWNDFEGSVVFGMNEAGCMEHVSISCYKRNRLPSWEIMCRTKDLFWRKDEMVVQIHPTEERYFHGFKTLTNVLHLWRPKDGNFELLNHPEKWD